MRVKSHTSKFGSQVIASLPQSQLRRGKVYRTALAVVLFGFGVAHSETLFAPAAVPNIVHTQSGDVRGIVAADVVSFRGIPYAASPTGERRWAMPEPTQPWEHVRDAFAYGTGCPQVARYGLTQAGYDENCLTVNVTVPRGAMLAGAKMRPVIAWIYGGAFVGGSSAL